ncbi:MAG: sulfurtransferase TusA family protein [bacterium]
MAVLTRPGRVEEPGADEVLRIDGGDLACGELLMVVYRRVRELPAGTLIGIVTSDPAASIDIPAWCHLTGHRYRGPAAGDSRGGRFIVELARRPSPVEPDRPWHRLPGTENS